MSQTIETPLTQLLGVKYPIILAGMNKAAGPQLAAAVTNAGHILYLCLYLYLQIL